MGEHADFPTADADRYITSAQVNDGQDEARAEWEAQHARRVMDATNEGVLIVNRRGIIEYANVAAEQILGWPRAHLLGKDVHGLMHPRTRHECVFIKPFADALPVPKQTDEFLTAWGRTVTVDLSTNPGVHRGIVTSVVCIFSDATERLREEQALRDALAREAEAAIRLRELNEQKTDFVYTVSHELRTPLSSVMGYLDLVLENEGLPAESREILEIVDRNAKRLLAQVEALLLVSKIESGVITANMTECDLVALIAAAVVVQQPVAARTGITIHVEIPDGLPAVHADDDQIERVLLNLLSNAVKFSPEGGNVYLSVHVTPGWVQIQVEDEGMGIPKAEQHRLFEKFFRSSISQKKATPGTGLGLAIVKAIVEEHGGKVAIDSEEGIGTAVAFTLPVGAPAADAPAQRG